MKLLFYKQLYPYPVTAGTDANTLNLLKLLSSRFEVHFVSFDTGHVTEDARWYMESIVARLTLIRPANGRSAAARMAFAAAYRARSALSGTPIGACYARVPPVRATLRRIAAESRYDVCIFAYWNAAQLAREMGDGPLKVVHLHDAQFMDPYRRAQVETDPAKKAALLRESERIKRFEVESYRRVDRIITQNPAESELYRSLLPGADVRSFPVLVDTDTPVPEEGPREPVVLFLGHYRHHPNVDGAFFLAREVWPHVRREVPEVRLEFVGRQAHEALAGIDDAPGVRIVGEVPDVRPVFDRAAVFASPMRTGTGIKIKILEAMAGGLPVVTTALGAEALGARRGEEIVVADEAGELAARIVELLRDPERARRIGRAGRDYILREHSAAGAGDRIVALYTP